MKKQTIFSDAVGSGKFLPKIFFGFGFQKLIKGHLLQDIPAGKIQHFFQAFVKNDDGAGIVASHDAVQGVFNQVVSKIDGFNQFLGGASIFFFQQGGIIFKLPAGQEAFFGPL